MQSVYGVTNDKFKTETNLTTRIFQEDFSYSQPVVYFSGFSTTKRELKLEIE